jgi:DNA ligase 1
VIDRLRRATKLNAAATVAGILDSAPASERYAVIKLVTGSLRIGASSRLVKQALANLGNVDVSAIEEVWHGLVPPYSDLFAWLEGRGERPGGSLPARYRPVMLAHALEDSDLATLNPTAFAVEWKWDGIRVQAVATCAERRLYTRTGEDIGAAFPDVIAKLDFEGALDGELLIKSAEGAVGSFNDLQQRLNRKTADKKLMERSPAFIRAYDILADGERDHRSDPFSERRRGLEIFVARHGSDRLDISPLVEARTWRELAELRSAPVSDAAEGLMLKRWDSPYLPGRPKGYWYKWKRDPYLVDCVLMYAQRGHGKRSSFYSDYTFGVWHNHALTPVGKAYFGFTDAELVLLDKFVREHTVERFGPVRAVRAGLDFGLVLEIAFEGLARSSRHKSGVAMRFPRVRRIRWDKPAAEADTLEALAKLIR